MAESAFNPDLVRTVVYDLRPRPYRCPCGCKATTPGPHLWISPEGFHHTYPDALTALAAQANSSPVCGYVRPVPVAA